MRGDRQLGLVHVGVIIALAVVIAGAIGWYVWDRNKDKNSSDSSQSTEAMAEPVGINGELTKVDLSAMATDGPGVFTIETDDGQKVVQLTSGESACDREAIAVPKDPQVGDAVEAVAIQRGNVYSVCEEGTYIKVTPAALVSPKHYDFPRVSNWGVNIYFPSYKQAEFKYNGDVLTVFLKDVKGDCGELGLYLLRNKSKIQKGVTLAGPIYDYYYGVAGDQAGCMDVPLRDKVAGELKEAKVTGLAQ